MGYGSFTLVFLGQGSPHSSHTDGPWRDAAGSCETATTLPSSHSGRTVRVSGCRVRAHCCQQEPFTSGDRESAHRDPRMLLLGPPCASGPFLPRHSCCAGSPEGTHRRVSQAPLGVGSALVAAPFCSALRALVLVRSLPAWYPDSTRLPCDWGHSAQLPQKEAQHSADPPPEVTAPPIRPLPAPTLPR